MEKESAETGDLIAVGMGLLEPQRHADLAGATTEVKRMLTALLQKLTADG